MTTSAERPQTRSSWNQLADRVAGNRVRAGIDRRVRRGVAAELTDDRRGLAAALRRPEVRQVIADEVGRQLVQSRDRDFTLDVVLGHRVRADRTLSEKRYKTLQAEIRAITGQANVEWQVQQAFRSLLDLEARGLGRVAGSTYNILGKLVTTPLLAPPPGPVLEIGTLYGLFAPALIRSFRRQGEFRDLTVVDPFAGLQVQGGADLKADRSGTPVSEEVARWNFTEFGLDPADVRVVPGFSTEDEVRTNAGDRHYSAVVVDGDHFAEGVEKDLWWVETITAPGAVVVMDDFGDKKWPGVEEATRRYLADGGKLELMGTVSSSAYLRMPTCSA